MIQIIEDAPQHSNVICQQYGETASTSVPVKRPFLRKLEDFALHYWDSFVAFHVSLAARMKRLSQGVADLRGEPGTGKTTYIRALMWQLRRTCRFYTIGGMKKVTITEA